MDRKIRRHLDRKSGIAIEKLRGHFETILQARLDHPAEPLSSEQQVWFRLLEEALASDGAQDPRSGNKSSKPAVSISVVKPASAM